jgi:hypothetical protein
MTRKQYVIDVIDANGEHLWSYVANTRADQTKSFQTALDVCLYSGGKYARSQTVGANTWAAYEFDGSALVQKHRGEADEIRAMWDR